MMQKKFSGENLQLIKVQKDHLVFNFLPQFATWRPSNALERSMQNKKGTNRESSETARNNQLLVPLFSARLGKLQMCVI